jgi:hypothetical protein
MSSQHAYGPQLPKRGDRFTHMHHLTADVTARTVRADPGDPAHYETCVITAVRRDYYGICVYYTTADLWDDLGVRRGIMSTHKLGDIVRQWHHAGGDV